MWSGSSLARGIEFASHDSGSTEELGSPRTFIPDTFSSVPLKDIPGLGKAAFPAPTISQLNVFIDDARMKVVTVEKVHQFALSFQRSQECEARAHAKVTS